MHGKPVNLLHGQITILDFTATPLWWTYTRQE